jgi:hypothetical protein
MPSFSGHPIVTVYRACFTICVSVRVLYRKQVQQNVYAIIRGDLLNCLMRPEAGESHNGYLQTEELGKPVAAQSMKLEISEQEGP